MRRPLSLRRTDSTPHSSGLASLASASFDCAAGGFVKSASATLHGTARRCDVPIVRLTLRGLCALHLHLLTVPRLRQKRICGVMLSSASALLWRVACPASLYLCHLGWPHAAVSCGMLHPLSPRHTGSMFYPSSLPSRSISIRQNPVDGSRKIGCHVIGPRAHDGIGSVPFLLSVSG